MLDGNIAPPEKEEIFSAIIKFLKNSKAPRQDNLKAELLKALLPLFTTIWEEKEIPSDWLEGIFVKIPKKGTLNKIIR